MGPINKPMPAADSAKPRYFSLLLEKVLVRIEYVDVEPIDHLLLG